MAFYCYFANAFCFLFQNSMMIIYNWLPVIYKWHNMCRHKMQYQTLINITSLFTATEVTWRNVYVLSSSSHSGPEVLFKTCVAMKFVDDDDDDHCYYLTTLLYHDQTANNYIRSKQQKTYMNNVRTHSYNIDKLDLQVLVLYQESGMASAITSAVPHSRTQTWEHVSPELFQSSEITIVRRLPDVTNFSSRSQWEQTWVV